MIVDYEVTSVKIREGILIPQRILWYRSLPYLLFCIQINPLAIPQCYHGCNVFPLSQDGLLQVDTFCDILFWRWLLSVWV